MMVFMRNIGMQMMIGVLDYPRTETSSKVTVLYTCMDEMMTHSAIIHTNVVNTNKMITEGYPSRRRFGVHGVPLIGMTKGVGGGLCLLTNLRSIGMQLR